MMPAVTLHRVILSMLLAAMLALCLAAPAGAGERPAPLKPPAGVAIGKPAIGVAASGTRSILVPVRYPIQMAGRMGRLTIWLADGQGKPMGHLQMVERLSSGPELRPEKRRRFRFVHQVDLAYLKPGPNAPLGKRLQVRLHVRGDVDLEEDGRAELASGDHARHSLRTASSGGGLCGSVPHRRLRPGSRLSVPLPACETRMAWRVFDRPERGSARIRHGRLIYDAAPRFRGSAQVQLIGKRLRDGRARGSALRPLVPGYVNLTVGTADDAVVRALGDSVTAGFGYYSNGTPMTIGRLPGCRPAAKEFNDACSSNSLNFTSKPGKVVYAPDYGLANDVSWAAQWANEHGITDFKNFAVSGSEPANWAPGGELHKTAELLASESPDYILMTIGANPLLSEMLFGVDNMGCAVESDVVGGYRECVEKAFAEVGLQANLESLYKYLVQDTEATIFLMQYHLSVPSSALAYSATQIAMMGKLLNREIAKVAGEVNSQRLQVVAPPHFDVGIDISPVFPSTFSCSRFGYEVDGPSVQSTPTQDELEVLHPLSFCAGPERGPPWVISGDTGIHPSAAGYTQMASRLPPPS